MRHSCIVQFTHGTNIACCTRCINRCAPIVCRHPDCGNPPCNTGNSAPPPYSDPSLGYPNPNSWVIGSGASLPLGPDGGAAFWDRIFRDAADWGLTTFKLDHAQSNSESYSDERLCVLTRSTRWPCAVCVRFQAHTASCCTHCCSPKSTGSSDRSLCRGHVANHYDECRRKAWDLEAIWWMCKLDVLAQCYTSGKSKR